MRGVSADYFLINIRKFRERAAGHISKGWLLTVTFNIML